MPKGCCRGLQIGRGRRRAARLQQQRSEAETEVSSLRRVLFERRRALHRKRKCQTNHEND